MSEHMIGLPIYIHKGELYDAEVFNDEDIVLLYPLFPSGTQSQVSKATFFLSAIPVTDEDYEHYKRIRGFIDAYMELLRSYGNRCTHLPTLVEYTWDSLTRAFILPRWLTGEHIRSIVYWHVKEAGGLHSYIVQGGAKDGSRS